jgi:hypothetical protein
VSSSAETGLVTIHFIDSRTGERLEGIAARDWPTIPRTGDNVVLATNPMRQFTVVKATWIDSMRSNGALLARLVVDEIN